MMLWLVTVSPGCLMITYGANGILQERLVTIGRFGRDNHVWTGAGAVGWGWIFVGVGFWALGYFSHLKTGYVMVKILGWVLGGIAAVIGVGVFLNEFAGRGS